MENTFNIPIIPDNDEERLAKLLSYRVLDSYDEGIFQHIAVMAAHMFKVPIALISLVDRELVRYKANFGMEGIQEVSRGISLCSLAVLHEGITLFEDAKEDPCLLANPLVSGEFGLRFYAAAPLGTPDGYNIGSICIVDKKPRKINEEDQSILKNLASLIIDEFEMLKRSQQNPS